jgi:hypothetical protein
MKFRFQRKSFAIVCETSMPSESTLSFHEWTLPCLSRSHRRANHATSSERIQNSTTLRRHCFCRRAIVHCLYSNHSVRYHEHENRLSPCSGRWVLTISSKPEHNRFILGSRCNYQTTGDDRSWHAFLSTRSWRILKEYTNEFESFSGRPS